MRLPFKIPLAHREVVNKEYLREKKKLAASPATQKAVRRFLAAVRKARS